MSGIDYRLLNVEDVIHNYLDLKDVMDIILKENICHNFSMDLSQEYINKLPEFIKDESAVVIGAFDKNNLIGFHWCYYINNFNERRLHSNFVGVKIEYQGYGIAKVMMECIERIALENEVYIIEAMVTSKNTKALKYHQNQGFKIERLKMRKELRLYDDWKNPRKKG